MMGGVILALLSTFIYAIVKKINFLKIGDVLAPSFLLGAGFQRIGGCFLNGCCYGKPTDTPFGIIFPSNSVAGYHFHDVPIFPAQLFSAVLCFAGFFLVLWLDKRHSFSSYTLWITMTVYIICRFIADQFRYYESSQILGKAGPFIFNANHILLGGLLCVSISLWLLGWRKKQRPSA